MPEYIEREAMSTELQEHEKIKAFNPQIIVCGKPNKPYYNISYYDVDKKEWYIGFGSYCLDYVRTWLEEEFEEVDVDVAPVVHGRWIPVMEDLIMKCSVCKREHEFSHGGPIDEGVNYCLYCGALLDGKDDEDGK